MISVVIPLYNKEKQIRKTLQTVLNQTFNDFEIIVVNDGSTDGSLNEVKQVSDFRLRLVNQKNSGVSVARNRGVEEARGEYIAFLDADDEWYPDYLETQYDLIKKYSECQVFAVNYKFQDSKGKISNTLIKKLPFIGTNGELSNYFEVASCSHPPLWTSAVVVKKTAFEKVGGFPEGIKSGEDLLTWAYLAVLFKIAYSSEIKAIFNLDDGHSIVNKPSRPHDENDYVANELIKLLNIIDGNRKSSLKKYISLWYKMKVSVFVRMEDVKNTWKYGCKSISYNVLNYKVYLMMILVLLPSKFQFFLKKIY